MFLYKPTYYDRFRCAAGMCPDSCCKQWEVQVDDASAQFYRALPGALGDRLREVLNTEDGETVMTIIDGRCPMWRRDGLCRIQAELGEGALCETCRVFPRLTHDYGDFVELGLELSCPEAAKLILDALPAPLAVEERTGDGMPEYDQEAMAVLKASREMMLAILSDDSRPVGESMALGLLYGCQAQSELDGGEPAIFDTAAALEEANALAKPGSASDILKFFQGLELLTPEWETMLRHPSPGSWTQRHRALARHLTQRYWLQAISDLDLYCRTKFILISCLLVKLLGGDIFSTAQLYSKEIENDTDNVEAILDAAYTHPAFTDDKLLGMLLEIQR
ncbi:MAG: flagellin lysine-N-methylase [Faecousia sp.]